ncbi:MAG: isochorismatase family protein, partial [Alphaproteobacteria bacterium]|nr:isochorismatase family protein [Alphaproteobacteria bacterium]
MPRPLADKTDPAKTALVVIDVQNDFCHRDGLFPRLGADVSAMAPMVARIEQLVAEARRLDILILWVRATYDPVVRGAALDDALDKPGLDANGCQTGTFGAEWYGALAPDPQAANEIELTKHRYSAFWDTAIDLYLRSNAVENVVLTGVITSGCVESTGRDAFFRNYFVVIPEDSCASFSPEQHDASLRKFAQTMGSVPPSADVLALWQAAQPGPRGWHLDEKKKKVMRGLPAVAAPAHTALLVIDMQNDFCHPSGVMAQRGADTSGNQVVIPVIAGLL